MYLSIVIVKLQSLLTVGIHLLNKSRVWCVVQVALSWMELGGTLRTVGLDQPGQHVRLYLKDKKKEGKEEGGGKGKKQICEREMQEDKAETPA